MSGHDLEAILAEIVASAARETDRGTVATYIPELAGVDPGQFGIAVVPIEGAPVSAGDSGVPFSIQSISKVFSLTLALERVGAALWQRVGREPSGSRFNSIIQLELEKGIPRNPLINPGAIVVADAILGDGRPSEAIEALLAECRRLAGDPGIRIDEAVAESEWRTGSRNRALAEFMKSEGNLNNAVDDVLQVYFHQCAIAMTCEQLARAASYLAASGFPRGSRDPVITPDRARRLNALMMTCGLYDASGEFAFRVGIPAKSGVGGGMMGVVPGIASIAAWSPGLGTKGNSRLAARAFEQLVRATGWSVFGPLRDPDD